MVAFFRRLLPAPRRPWLTWVACLALLGGCLYAGAILVLWLGQGLQLFPGATFANYWREPYPELAAEDVYLELDMGESAHAWWCAPPGWKPKDGTILYSHGNGGNLSKRQGAIRRWQLATGMVAVEMGARHGGRLLVLLCPFTSIPDMARYRFPWLPGPYLVNARFDSLAKVPQLSCPVFIAHGEDDTVVPVRHGKRLFEAASEPKRFLAMPGRGHCHPGHPDFFDAVKGFLAETR